MGREYERTHPWLSFQVDLSAAPPDFWMLLGEAASKCQHVADVPLKPSVAQAVHRLYLRDQQWWIAWENFVDERFRGQRGGAAARRKQLLLDLANAERAVSKANLRTLSAHVAADYAKKTDKTLSRDLNALVQAGLIEQSPAGYRARREIILAFLPLRAPERRPSEEPNPSGRR